MIFLYIDYIYVLYLRASNCRVKISATFRCTQTYGVIR